MVQDNAWFANTWLFYDYIKGKAVGEKTLHGFVFFVDKK